MGPTALWVGRPALCLLVSCRCAAGSTPLRRTRPSIIDQRSSINDQRSIGGLSAAFATAPVISGAGRMQMQVLRNLRSATCDQRSAIIGSSSPPIYALPVLQTSEIDGPAESRVFGLRSSLMVFNLLYLSFLVNCVFDVCHKSQVIPSR